MQEIFLIYSSALKINLVDHKHQIETPDHKDLPNMVIAVPNAYGFSTGISTFLKFEQGANDGRINKGDVGHIDAYLFGRINA